MKIKGVSGYTLVELLVVVGIIVLMTGVSFPLWSSVEKDLALDRVVHKTGQDVRRVQELALRSQNHICTTPGMSIYGYGIYFDSDTPTSYILFAECNSQSIGYDERQDDIVENVQLESGVRIVEVSPTPQMSIVFVPPLFTTFLRPGNPDSVEISFQGRDGVGDIKKLNVTQRLLTEIALDSIPVITTTQSSPTNDATLNF